MLAGQDILLALALCEGEERSQVELARALGIGQAQVSVGLKRLREAGLVERFRQRVIRGHLLELLVHGVRYFFPARLGLEARGVPTAGLMAPLHGAVRGANVTAVWLHAHGTDRAPTLEPIHKAVPFAALQDPVLHRRLALVDGIRLGGARLRELSTAHLTKELLGEVRCRVG